VHGQEQIRELTLHYVAVDQFFILFPPHDGQGNIRTVIVPATARTVAAQAFLFPNRRSRGAPRLVLEQGTKKLRREAPNVNLDAAPYGPARRNEPISARIVGPVSPSAVVGLVLEWA
jgi:hypothetical protein